MDAFMSRAGELSFGEVLTAVARVLSAAGSQNEAATRAFTRLFGDPKELAGIASCCDTALLSYHIGLLLVVSLCSRRAWTLLERELGAADARMECDVSPEVSQRLYTLLKEMLQRRSCHTVTFAEAAAFTSVWLT